MCSTLYKEQGFFISCYSPSTVFFFIAGDIKYLFLPLYDSLKLNHDIDYLMTPEDMVEDPLVCVQFFLYRARFFISSYSLSTVLIFIARDA